jgi:hypothetical protein
MKKKELLEMILALQGRLEDLEEKFEASQSTSMKKRSRGCDQCGLTGLAAFTCTQATCPLRCDGGAA